MSVKYVCYDCGKKLGLSGAHAVNEVGRKRCDNCGSNDDDLEFINEHEFNRALNVEKADPTCNRCGETYSEMIGYCTCREVSRFST